MKFFPITLCAFIGLTAFGARQPQEQATHFTAADIERAFQSIPTKPPTNKNIIEQQHYTVAVARVAGRNGPVELHRDSDRVFFVKAGKALMRVGGRLTNAQEIEPGEWRSADGKGYSEFRAEQMAAGSIISVPRNVPYQLIAQQGDVSFTVVRIK
ncbi:MAG: hypothetical protein ACKV2V_13925 [Blastocatellia bacterium]